MLDLVIHLRHDDVIKWKKIPRYWSFVRGIHRSPVNSPHKGQCRGALMFSLIYARINGWVTNREAGDLGCDRTYHDVTVMSIALFTHTIQVYLLHWHRDSEAVTWQWNYPTNVDICIKCITSQRNWWDSLHKTNTTKPCLYLKGYTHHYDVTRAS